MESQSSSTVKEPVQINHVITEVMEQIEVVSTSSPFIEANTWMSVLGSGELCCILFAASHPILPEVVIDW